MKKQIVILLIISAFIHNSCKKESASKKENNPINSSTSYTLSSYELLPMQMVTLKASQSILDSNLRVSVNNEALVLTKVSETEFNFLCPILHPGSYKIIFENKSELSFNVKIYDTLIQNPETNFSLFKSEIDQLTTNLQNSTLSNKTEIANEFLYYKSALDEITSKITSQEKLQLAYFIHSNGFDKSDFSDEWNLNIPDSFLGKSSSFDPTNAANVFVKKYTAAKLNFIVFMSAAVALFKTPEPTNISKGLAVISSFVAATNVAIMYRLIDKELPVLIVKASGIEALQKKPSVITFYNNNPSDIDYLGTFTNIVAEDKDKNIMPSLFSGISEMNEKLNLFYDAYLNIKSWFSASQPTKNKKLFVVGNTIKQKQFYLNPDFLSIKSVSNPQINLRLINEGGMPQILASSTTINTETNFSFTLSYKQESINNSYEQTFTAVLKPEVFFLFDGANRLILDVVSFVSGTPQNFSITSDLKKPSPNADYSKIEVKNISNQNVLVEVIPNSDKFALRLTNNGLVSQTASFDLNYKGVLLQRLTTIVSLPCNTLTAAMTISGKVVTASATGGIAPYQFKFTNGFSSTLFSSTNQFTLTHNGNYYAYVTDASGCIDTLTDRIDDVTNVEFSPIPLINGNQDYPGRFRLKYNSTLGLLPEFLKYVPSTQKYLLFYIPYNSLNISLGDGPLCDSINIGGRVNQTGNTTFMPGYITFIGPGRVDDSSPANLKFRVWDHNRGTILCPNYPEKLGVEYNLNNW